MTIGVRALSAEERSALTQLASWRKRGAGLVRRAPIVLHAVEGLSAPQIATTMKLCGHTVRFWLKRFNERGVQGLWRRTCVPGARRAIPPRNGAQ